MRSNDSPRRRHVRTPPVLSGVVAQASQENPRATRLMASHELLGGERRVWIEHDSQRYLLQVTKSNKLILTK